MLVTVATLLEQSKKGVRVDLIDLVNSRGHLLLCLNYCRVKLNWRVSRETCNLRNRKFTLLVAHAEERAGRSYLDTKTRRERQWESSSPRPHWSLGSPTLVHFSFSLYTFEGDPAGLDRQFAVTRIFQSPRTTQRWAYAWNVTKLAAALFYRRWPVCRYANDTIKESCGRGTDSSLNGYPRPTYWNTDC